eukprot:2393888-Amphidinium_carterae.1
MHLILNSRFDCGCSVCLHKFNWLQHVLKLIFALLLAKDLNMCAKGSEHWSLLLGNWFRLSRECKAPCSQQDRVQLPPVIASERGLTRNAGSAPSVTVSISLPPVVVLH